MFCVSQRPTAGHKTSDTIKRLNQMGRSYALAAGFEKGFGQFMSVVPAHESPSG